MKLKESLLKILKDLGIDVGEKSSEIEAALEQLEPKQPTTAPATPANRSTDGSVNAEDLGRIIQEAVAAHTKPIVDELEAQKTARTKAEEARTAAEQKAREDEITALLDTCVKDGRIVEDERDAWKERLSGGYDIVKPILDGMAKNEAIGRKSIKETGATGTATTGTPAATGTQSYRELREAAIAELKAAREG